MTCQLVICCVYTSVINLWVEREKYRSLFCIMVMVMMVLGRDM